MAWKRSPLSSTVSVLAKKSVAVIFNGILRSSKRSGIASGRKARTDRREVIAAILQARGMNFGDTTRATAYYRKPEFKQHFDAWRKERDLAHMPVVDTHSVVCRDDLLFELELDAGRASG